MKELRKTHFRDATAEVVVVVIVSVARRIVNLYIVSDRRHVAALAYNGRRPTTIVRLARYIRSSSSFDVDHDVSLNSTYRGYVNENFKSQRSI